MDRVHPRVVFPDLVLLFPSRRPLRRGDPRLGRPNGRRHDDSLYPTAVKAMTTDLGEQRLAWSPALEAMEDNL